MKFGQLIEYNTKNIFLEKSYTKLFPDPFLKNQNWAYLWISSVNFYTACFYWLPCWELSTYIETKLQTTYFSFLSSFFKNKKRSGTSLPASFSAWFLTKNIFLVMFYYLTKFHCLAAFTSWDIGQYVYCNCLLTRLWFHLKLT